MGLVLGILFLALIIGSRIWRRATHGLPRTYYVPTSAPKPGESIQEYYARMEGCGGSQNMDDAEFVERGYRQPYHKPFCTLRLNGSEQLEALQEKEGYGSRE